MSHSNRPLHSDKDINELIQTSVKNVIIYPDFKQQLQTGNIQTVENNINGVTATSY